MKTSVFQTKLRQIRITIDNEFIRFSFPEERDREFYGIPIKGWVRDKYENLDRGDNWHIHMMEKTWFTEGMKEFIDNNTKE